MICCSGTFIVHFENIQHNIQYINLLFAVSIYNFEYGFTCLKTNVLITDWLISPYLLN